MCFIWNYLPGEDGLLFLWCVFFFSIIVSTEKEKNINTAVKIITPMIPMAGQRGRKLPIYKR